MQILSIVRDHYDTLTLKLQDSLDRYEKYVENPGELPFLAKYCTLVVVDNRASLTFDNKLDASLSATH